MKITKTQLKQIIKEELNESEWIDVHGAEALPPHSLGRGAKIETDDAALSLGMDQEATGDIGPENQALRDLAAAVTTLRSEHGYDASEILEIVTGLVSPVSPRSAGATGGGFPLTDDPDPRKQ